ncbi:hypothetical protein TL16_g07855 [Triparma laevis f. inornata]|uniref:Uncharacterized protein n=1 Tax=Triparma laevis f. inornata TaxID=1714386 RepID=A0A9W7AUI4_9STRA|nr:hypothetical protein TL16_g07855 [Triparma laevis f. inornata]
MKLFIIALLLTSSDSWLSAAPPRQKPPSILLSTVSSVPETLAKPRNKLTLRQKQFWEDVETSVFDIQKAFQSSSSELTRIDSFQTIAQWKTSPPQPSAELHDPCEEYMPGLTAKPFWENDPKLFPWMKPLEDQSATIITEFFEVMEKEDAARNEEVERLAQLKAMYDVRSEDAPTLFNSDSAWQNDVMGSGWSAVRLQRLGEWNTENCARFPKTYEVGEN